ncbi:hypothetical protein ASE37_24790 [Rhizobium sp. Root268]|nr:hypothetical protein [Rhizobium sp. Root268]KRD25402.1 hypothetical protein ASE37_24790 [Rhizobium sp. Root268]
MTRAEAREAEQAETVDEVGEVLAWHDGDVRASIRTLLADLKQTREQLAFAEQMIGNGFSRGWKPSRRKENDDARDRV